MTRLVHDPLLVLVTEFLKVMSILIAKGRSVNQKLLVKDERIQGCRSKDDKCHILHLFGSDFIY